MEITTSVFKLLSACNQTLTRDSGYIVSPYYPGFYDDNTMCEWQVKAPPNHVIKLEFHSFDLEPDPQCTKDYVEVYDGLPTSRVRLGRFCGHDYPTMLRSSARILTLKFRSDQKTIGPGFKASYSIIKG